MVIDPRLRLVTAVLVMAAAHGVWAEGLPDPEQRKPEVVANWDRLGADIRKNIAASEPYLFRTLQAYWADTPPAMDGKTGDACWQEAEVATDFILHDVAYAEIKKPVNQTEVRVCYDADNLYVLYTLFDQEMDKLALGQPQDYRDIMNNAADMIELFLDPTPGMDRTVKQHADNAYFMLASNPRGTTYDTRGYSGYTWNPDWEVKTDVTETFWTVEARIPFAALSLNGRHTATPRKGEVWGALFARDQSTLHEWSRWNINGMVSPHGFHAVENWGRLVFMGRKDGNALPMVEVLAAPPPFYGRNTMTFSCTGQVDEAALRVALDGKIVEERKIAVSPRFDVTYQVADGGDVQVSLSLLQDKQRVYAFSHGKALFPAKALFGDIHDQSKPFLEKIERIRHPQAPALKERCGGLVRAIAPLETRLADGTLREADTQTLKDLKRKWDAFQYDLFRLKVYPEVEDGTIHEFAAIPVAPTTKVFRRRPVTADHEDAIRLASARRETESFQIALVPFWQGQDTVTVSVTEIKGESGVIPAHDVSWYRVDYVQVETNHLKTLPGYDPDDPRAMLWWPDVLWPGDGGVALPADRNTTLWFDVYCAPGTPAGVYRGEVSLGGTNESVRIPIALTVRDFELPATPTLKNNHWFSHHYLRQFYGDLPYMKDNASFLAEYEQQLKFLSRYRCATYPYASLWQWIAVTLEPDGHYTFDFSELRDLVQLCRRHGANFLCSAGGVNSWNDFLSPRFSLKVTERSSGKVMEMRDCPNMKPFIQERNSPEVDFAPIFDSPVFKDYLPQLVRFMRENGILDESYFEIFDEAPALTIATMHKYLRRIAPDLPLLSYGSYPAATFRNVKCVGYHDIWAPQLRHFGEPGVLEEMKARRALHGERYGFYVSGSMPREDGRVPPFSKIYDPAIGVRMLPWFAWKYDCDHFLLFMFFAGMPPKGWPEKPAVCELGYGTLVYPGPAYALMPSIRLACLRDGMEDNEYFHILRQAGAYLDAAFEPHRALLAGIRQELAVEDAIITQPDVWTRDVARLEEKRGRLAELIEETQRAIAEYPGSRLKSNVR